MKNIEDSLRNLWGKIKCIDIWTIGVLEEKRKGLRKEIIVENLTNMGKKGNN